MTAYLLNEGARPGVRSSTGISAALIAAKNRDVSMLETLIAHHVPLRKKTKVSGIAAIHLCVQEGYQEILDLLLEADPGMVDLRTKKGASPLMIAARKGLYTIAQKLLAAGADAEFQMEVTPPDDGSGDIEIMTPTTMAKSYGHEDVVDLLSQYSEL